MKAKAKPDIEARRRRIRRMKVEGDSDFEICRKFAQGVQIDNRIVKASPAVVRADLAAVASSFRGVFSDADAIDIEIGAALTRMIGIASKSATGKRPDFRAAIQANAFLVKTLAPMSTAFRAAAGPAQIEPEGPETPAETIAMLRKLPRHMLFLALGNEPGEPDRETG